MANEKADERTVHAEHGARRSGANDGRIGGKADRIAEHTRHEIETEIAGAPDHALDNWAAAPERQHVHGEMKHADMNEHGAEHAPPLALSNGPRTEVSSPQDQAFDRGIEHVDAAGDHGDEDRGIQTDQQERDRGRGRQLTQGVIQRVVGCRFRTVRMSG